MVNIGLPFNKKPEGIGWLSIIFVYMEITPEMINNLAHLSRLDFNEDEKKAIGADLQKMVAFVEKLQELDITRRGSLVAYWRCGECIA